MTKWIASRELLFSPKGADDRRELTIRIGEPYIVQEGDVSFRLSKVMMGCSIEVKGIDGNEVFEGSNTHEVYGADSVQALEIAVNVEPLLRRLNKKYDIYFPDGELYFDPNADD